ncbi:MAG: MMPL family transporter [Myxococcales bacterium]|nr:MMPL family transporter [Myxococcales bacterium]
MLLSAVLGLPPDVDPDVLSLLPGDEPAVKAVRELQDSEGGISLVTLSFTSDDPDLLDATMRRMATKLGDLERVEYALYQVDPELTKQLGLLQLEASEVDTLNTRLRAALSLGSALNPIVTQRLMAMGPLTERIQKLSEAPDLLQGGAGRGRILVRPTVSSHDQKFAALVMADIERVLAAEETPGVRTAWVGGAYRHVVEDSRGIKSDLFWTTFVSLGLVLLVTIVAFRSWRSTLLVFGPLIAANVVVLGLVGVFLGSLNTYTSFGTAILIGLGIDFAVHLVGRYREYRAQDVPLEEAIERAWDRTGPPCMTAALTSMAGFLALAAADFQGFAQLGVLLAVGLLVCLVAMLVLLPVLIPSLDRDAPPLLGTVGEGEASRSTYRLAPLGLGVALASTVVVGFLAAPNLRWEYDISELRREGMAWSELSEEQRKLVKESYSPMFVATTSPAELTRLHTTVAEALEAGRLPHIARAVSVQTVLPPDQEERVRALQELVRLVGDDDLKYLPPPLVKRLMPLRGQAIGMKTVADLPRPVVELLGVKEGMGPRMLLFAQGNMWDLRETAALEEETNAVLGEGAVAGDYVTLGALYRIIRRDMPVVAALAFLMVLVLTEIDLRRQAWVAAAMATLLAGLVWAAFLTSLVGVELSIMNVVGVPILVGIGVDVVIHLLHRLRDEGPGGVRRALRTTGVAASISTLTTIASFASLVAAGNRGVQSLGLLVVFGLAAVFGATCVILPLMWAAGWRVTGRAPGLDATPTPGAPRRT